MIAPLIQFVAPERSSVRASLSPNEIRRREVASDVFCMPTKDHVDFGMLLQFFERICPRCVQQPILCLRFVDPSCYQ